MATSAVSALFSELLSSARARFFESARGLGSRCPCCGRWGKYAKRSLNSTMARSLIWLVGEHLRAPADDPWVYFQNAPQALLRTKQLSTLKHWGLVQSKPQAAGAVRSSGFWAPTLLGEQFVRGAVRVPAFVWVYDDEKKGESPETVSIIEALGTSFDYSEMMQAQAGAPRPPRMTIAERLRNKRT